MKPWRLDVATVDRVDGDGMVRITEMDGGVKPR